MKKRCIAIILVTIISITTSGFIWQANLNSKKIEPETLITDTKSNGFEIHANAGAGEPVDIPSEFLTDDPLNNVDEMEEVTMDEMEVLNRILEEKLANLVEEQFNEHSEYTGERPLDEIERELVEQSMREAKEFVRNNTNEQ